MEKNSLNNTGFAYINNVHTLEKDIIDMCEKLYMGKARFRKEKYWTYIEFYGELVFDDKGKKWLEICHYSPSRDVISFSSIQFNLILVKLVIEYCNEVVSKDK